MVDRFWLCNKVCCNRRDVIKCDSPTYFYFVRSCFCKNTTDQRIHNTSLTLGPEDTLHIPYTGTRGHTTHPSHWDQRTHNTSLHWDQRTQNTSLTLGPEDKQHIPYTGTRGHTTCQGHFMSSQTTYAPHVPNLAQLYWSSYDSQFCMFITLMVVG